MHHTGSEFILHVHVSIRCFNKESDEREIAMVGGEVDCCESLISLCVDPLSQVLFLLLEGSELGESI
jgi:hypothetical protein